jgi:hypothetical protein
MLNLEAPPNLEDQHHAHVASVTPALRRFRRGNANTHGGRSSPSGPDALHRPARSRRQRRRAITIYTGTPAYGTFSHSNNSGLANPAEIPPTPTLPLLQADTIDVSIIPSRLVATAEEDRLSIRHNARDLWVPETTVCHSITP